MFASSGYFRGLPCPYFASGLCERKYCHFRHVKQPDDTNDMAYCARMTNAVENGTRQQLSAGQGPGLQRHSSLLGMMGSAIQQVQRDVTPKYCTSKRPPSTTPVTEAVCYQPTPIVKGGVAVLAKQDVAPKQNSMEYNPTPIPLLRQLHEKRKQDPEGASEMEYDPLTNFSTSGPSHSWCATRVTLGDVPMYEAASKRKRNSVVERSNKKARSVHECGDESDSDNDIVAKFSDDDDEEETAGTAHVEKSVTRGDEKVCKKTSKADSRNQRTNAASADVSKVNNKTHVTVTVSCDDTLDHKPVLVSLQESLTTIKDSESSCVKVKHEFGTNLEVPPNGIKKELCEEVKEDHVHKTSQAKSAGKGSTEKSIEPSKTSSDDKKRTSSKHSHRDSKSSKSSSSAKHHSSSDKNKANSSNRSGSKHRHSSTTKHNSHSSKNSKSTVESTHSSGSKSHSSGRRHQQGSGSSNSSSSKENSSGKRRHNVTPVTSRSNSLPTDITKEEGHLLESHTNGKGLGRSLSHADLFGDDSDSDNLVERAGGGVTGAPIQISDDSAYEDDVMLMSPERPPVEDFSEPEDLYDECLSIFNEKSTQHNNGQAQSTDVKKAKMVEEDDTIAVGKTRVARLIATDSRLKKVVSRQPASCPSPAEVMHNRLRQMQEKQKQATLTNMTSNGNISKATHAALERRTACNLPNRRLRDMSRAATECTITASKVASRIAHAAKQTARPRPTIPAEFGSKVPTSVRQRYLSNMVDECLKIYPVQQDAYDRALAEEKTAYDRSSGRNIYLRVAVNAIKKLRSEVAGTKGNQDEGVTNPMSRTHEAVLGGLKARTTSFTVKRCGVQSKCQEIFTGADLYRRLTPYILTEEQLVENGFPRPGTDGAQVSLNIPQGKMLPKPNSNSRVCCRCGTRFDVLPNMKYAKKEQCVYHWGKCWKKRVAGSVDSRYTCCGGDIGTPGCALSEWHAYETNKYMDLSGYMKTIPGSPRPRKDYDVFSMDCEMVYTAGGSELARVTVIGPDLKPVFEKLVKPDHRIIDYNTRFSGLKESDLAGVETTLRDVQAVLLSLFTDKTILIGHSLESDLVALKLIHSTVVDTSVVFPHRLGAPYKRALRTLMADFLQRIIQNDVGGHDSSEDAIACMELMLWKLKEDARKDART